MVSLQVRDFPEDLYEELKVVAKKEHRSIAQQTIVAVQYYLLNKDERGSLEAVEKVRSIAEQERWSKALKRIDNLPRVDVPDGFPTIVELIREDRDSR